VKQESLKINTIPRDVKNLFKIKIKKKQTVTANKLYSLFCKNVDFEWVYGAKSKFSISKCTSTSFLTKRPELKENLFKWIINIFGKLQIFVVRVAVCLDLQQGQSQGVSRVFK